MRSIRESFARNLVLGLVCSFLLLPLYITIVNAFKTNNDIRRDPLSFPIDRMSLDNLAAAASSTSVNLLDAYVRTAVITTASVAVLIILGSMIGYVAARVRGRASPILYLLIAVGLFIPGNIILIPAVKVLQALGLLFTPQGLVLYNVAGSLPFATLVFVAIIRTIPKELDEAGVVDGATRLQIYWNIILPLTVPAIAVVAIFAGLGFWTDYIGPNVILSPDGAFTVTTGIVRAVGRYTTDYELLFGWLFIVIAPALLFFALMQRYFVSGLTAGAVKN